MKKLVLLGMLMVCGSGLEAAGFDATAGVGVAAPDNENVESAGIGKVDLSWRIGKFVSWGVSAGQTGKFDQQTVPQEVQYANASPQAFAGKSYHPHGGDVIIVDNSDVTTIINITEAPDKLPVRPTDTTERNFWFSDSFVQVGLPIWIKSFILRPYVRGFIGAAGVKSYDGAHRIGLSKGLGGGLSLQFGDLLVGAEYGRRHIETSVNTYGTNEVMGRLGFAF